MLKVYAYEKCDTCRKALKFLDQKKIAHETKAIVDTPPSVSELKQMLAYVDGDVRKLFNTSGQVYRELKVGEKLKDLSEAEAIKLLAAHGKLVKRPFALGKNFGMVGFKEAEWKERLSRAR